MFFGSKEFSVGDENEGNQKWRIVIDKLGSDFNPDSNNFRYGEDD